MSAASNGPTNGHRHNDIIVSVNQLPTFHSHPISNKQRLIIMVNLIRPSDLPKLGESFSDFDTGLPLFLPVAVMNFPLLFHILDVKFPLPTLASKQF